MVAIPVAQPGEQLLSTPVPTQQGIFERGDRVYLTTPVTRIRPSASEIEEYAFSKAVKQGAPNENIVWLKGSYVEADRANANGAQWTAQELAIKSLTPMLMPVTVMHDPRTAVGTIADTKLVTKGDGGAERTRIDTVLALWGHRFPEAVHEAEANADAGTLMQSMECFSPWYECSECHALFHKLPGGAEQAQWCQHLKASNPSAGFVDLGADARTSNASRILGDVCFTGTGLIFGTRGAKGAYSEAHLSSFEDEVASAHQAAHVFTASPSSTATGSDRSMGLVNIEQSELDLLRKERDDARAEKAQAEQRAQAADQAKAEADTKVEQAEAKVTQAEEAKAAAEQKVTTLEETANQATLKDTRWGKLGAGFVAKLGETTKSNLEAQARTMSDEDWDTRLKEVEELTAVKRDAKADGTPAPKDAAAELAARQAQGEHTFTLEELASTGTAPAPTAPSTPSRDEQRSVVGQLGGLFSKAGS